MTRTAYALLGPTASGKSKLALELAAWRPIEIVSVDSALVYRGMDIGTAKPSITDRAAVPRHLIDIVDPDHGYSTGRWRSDAIGAAIEIFQRKRIPLLVGGTMLYYRALIAGLDSLPQADAAIRAAIDADARLRGSVATPASMARPVCGQVNVRLRISASSELPPEPATSVHSVVNDRLSGSVARMERPRSGTRNPPSRIWVRSSGMQVIQCP